MLPALFFSDSKVVCSHPFLTRRHHLDGFQENRPILERISPCVKYERDRARSLPSPKQAASLCFLGARVASLHKSTLRGLTVYSLKPATGGACLPRNSADIRSQFPYPPIRDQHVTRKGFHFFFPSCQTQSALGCPLSTPISVFSVLLLAEASHQLTRSISSCSLAHG